MTTAAKGIAELISVTGQINVDFNDVSTVMKDSGVAIMGSAAAEGENRAIKAVEKALASPLLNDNQIEGAKFVLLNITYGDVEVLMDEISDVTDYIQDEAGSSADVIWGHGYDETLGNNINVTLIATGFNAAPDTGISQKEPAKRKMNLLEDKVNEVTAPLKSPMSRSNAWSNVAPEAAPVASNEEKSVEEHDEAEEPYLKQAEASEESKSEENQAEITFDISNESSEKNKEEDTSDENTVRYTLEDDAANEVNNTSSDEPVKRYMLDDEAANNNAAEIPSNDNETASWEVKNKTEETPSNKTTPENEEEKEGQHIRAEERISRIKELCQKLKTPSGLTELENEPAYKRRNLNLEDQPHSSESNVSRYSIDEEKDEETGEKKWNLRGNNSFLHDNVD